MYVIIFIILFKLTESNISIFYLNKFQHRPKEGKGGISLVTSVIKRAKRDNSLLFLVEDNLNLSPKEYSEKVAILKKANCQATLADDNYINVLKNLDKNIDNIKDTKNTMKTLACNVYSKDNSLTRCLPSYKNISVDGIKISIIGIPKPFDIGLVKTKNRILNLYFKKSLDTLTELIDLLRTNFNPNLIILLSNNEDNSALLPYIKSKDILLISNKGIQNYDNLKKRSMITKPLSDNQLGLFEIVFDGTSIVDYSNEIINLRIPNKKDIQKEKAELEKINSIKDKKRSNKLKKNFDLRLDRPVEEDKNIVNYMQ